MMLKGIVKATAVDLVQIGRNIIIMLIYILSWSINL